MSNKPTLTYGEDLGRKARRARERSRPSRRHRRSYRWVPAALVIAAFVVVGVVLVALTRGSSSSTSGEQMLNSNAPDFTLPAVGGGDVSLSDYRGKKNVLLFFNEGMGCPPCWQQARSLQEQRSELDEVNTELVAVMVDPVADLAQEARRWGISVPILSDTKRSASNAYQVLEGGMHPGVKPNHTFVLIDKGGKVVWWYDSLEMAASSDLVVAKVRELVG